MKFDFNFTHFSTIWKISAFRPFCTAVERTRLRFHSFRSLMTARWMLSSPLHHHVTDLEFQILIEQLVDFLLMKYVSL